MRIGSLCAITLTLLLGACAAPTPREPLKGHINAETASKPTAGTIPAPVQQTLALPKPKPAPKAETYSVVVNNVPVRDLLFALARDAKVNVDIHPGLTGNVTLNAIDQTLPQLLTRIAKQVDMRHELDGPNLAVMPDSPFLKHYKVDYVNMARETGSVSSVNSQVAAASPSGSSSAPKSGVTNTSSTLIENNSKHNFWKNLDQNIKDILRETDKQFPEGSKEKTKSDSKNANASLNSLTAGSTLPTDRRKSEDKSSSVEQEFSFREAASVIIHPETGIVSVRATSRQHEKISEFIEKVVFSANKQVMIEATIVEVNLNDGFEQGIDWTKIIKSGMFSLTGSAISTVTPSAISAFSMRYDGDSVNSAIKLLESFGTAKTLSSPRMSVLNNQTALLKVVENVVYFTVNANTSQQQTSSLTTVSTTPQSVSVGLVMAITPQISNYNSIILNVRPTISSISAFKVDPNPSIPERLQNLVPQIRTREIESVMRINDGEVAVLGGLMEEGIDYKTGRIPILGQAPVVGELLTARANTAKKTELVIFLRPIVLRDSSINGDAATYREMLPTDSFFKQPNEAQPFNIIPSR